MPRLLSVFALLLAAALPVAAHADSITYTFDLTQTNGGNIGFNNGQVVGTGSFTITTAGSAPGVGTYSTPNPGSLGSLTAINFQIDGLNISLADAGVNTATVTFGSAGVTQITYSTGSGYVSNGATFYFNGNSGTPSYAFSGTNGTYSTGIIGDITEVTAPTAVTPEPSALLLFGTGALGLAGLARRRLFS